MGNKLKTGAGELFNPKNSEFWTLLVGVSGFLAVHFKLVEPATWDKWVPFILGYTGSRFVSKTAKA